MRGITLADFLSALKRIRCSISKETILKYEQWNREFGDITR